MPKFSERPVLSPCAVCSGQSIELIPAFKDLPRATSDCRPFPAGGSLGICATCHSVQKPADRKWSEDASAIYSRYDIFRQAANGAEQQVFDQESGISLRRSEVVLSRLSQVYPFTGHGKALDVGCGNGPTLRVLSHIAPGWRLYGHELSDANAEILAKIPRFEKLYTGDPAEIRDRFDLITLSHSLEHLPEPVAGLATLREKLTPGGRLLVEVPNVRQNVYDLVVADHRSHFDPLTLAEAARRAGFAHAAVFDDWAFKELTLLASDSPLAVQSGALGLREFALSDVAQRVAWLASVVEAAKQTAASAQVFGLFGTAIAATWLLGLLQERTSFFVDEDKNRIGQRHEGRPILAPEQLPANATVFVPLVPNVASAVADRLAKLGIDARVPPRQDFRAA